MAPVSFYCNSYVENAKYSIVFNDSPYDILNNVQFDVSNINGSVGSSFFAYFNND